VTEIKRILNDRGLGMRKQFGQNFLIHSGARRTLLSALGVTAGMGVWEIGPGLGAMSAEFMEAGAVVTAFEIDRGFCALLREIFAREIGEGALTLVEGDARKTLPAMLARPDIPRPEGVFGNLPYNIAASFIADTALGDRRFPRALFTVQKEVARRMDANPGEKDYSAFSVICRWAYLMETAADFPPSFFWPQPEVDSRAVLLQARPDFPRCADPALFSRIVHRAFSSRRKTIKNNLAPLFGVETTRLLSETGIDENRRAETLGVEDFLRLSQSALSAIMTP
jgi:16S rRNA (adenine1518-N6/adenine1519-N6)-dimethyltransferase